MKLTLEDKLEIIRLYNEGYTVPRLCLKYSVGQSTIKSIERQYREHGIDSFKPKGKNTKYTTEFKFEIVTRVLNGESQSSIAAELCVNKGMIHSWVKKYQELGYNGLNTKQGRPIKMKPNKENKVIKENETLDEKDKRIKELEERNSQLEMENDLLKKLRALVQQRTQQQNKKK